MTPRLPGGVPRPRSGSKVVEGFLAELLGGHHPDLVGHRSEPPVHLRGTRRRAAAWCAGRSGRPATTEGHRPPPAARSKGAGSGPPAPARHTAGTHRRSSPTRRRARRSRTPTHTAHPARPARRPVSRPRSTTVAASSLVDLVGSAELDHALAASAPRRRPARPVQRAPHRGERPAGHPRTRAPMLLP